VTKKWIAEAKDPRWKKPYTELTYLPMQEVLKYLRANGLQDLHRHRRRAGLSCVPIPRSCLWHPARTGDRHRRRNLKYSYTKDGKPYLTKEPKLMLNDNNAGKPEGIHLMIGRRPTMAVGQLDRRPADARIHQGW
jgi:hypothetical protein